MNVRVPHVAAPPPPLLASDGRRLGLGLGAKDRDELVEAFAVFLFAFVLL